MKQNLNERLFDTVITEALRENLLNDYEKMKTETVSHEFSRKFNHKIEKLANRQNRGSFIKQITHKGVAIAAACLVVFFIGTNPTVSAYVNQYFMKIFPDSDTYYFSGEQKDIDFTLIRTDWLPDGYRLSVANYTKKSVILEYTDENENYILLRCRGLDSGQLSIDNEGVIKSQVDINGNEGTFYLTTDGGDNGLIWNDKELFYTLQSDLTKEEMIKIAKNVHFAEIKE
jgi:hypothetical protein